MRPSRDGLCLAFLLLFRCGLPLREADADTQNA
jgi:hypothetical protein